ncbi:MAG: NAD(P)/FAD-dependent oxidoreductase [Synechocystis sp.]|nr:NAD(P)/FAD-dependent oxidoreductase [Synechocystis sp.]
MEQFEAVVIGGGPAGGQCARQLAQQGIKVLLVEQHQDFQQNNYSSAASPLEILSTFNLPETVVACYWFHLAIAASQTSHQWYSDQPRGVVFDFAKLRTFLAEDTEKQGGTLWLGSRFIGYQDHGDGIIVTLRQRGNQKIQVKTQLLIDATGSKRAVINAHQRQKPDPNDYLRGIGTEYLIEVDAATHGRYAQTLVFFLGYRWSPQGYSWIFPMDNHQLKVGTAIFAGKHRYLDKLQPIRAYTEAIIQDYLKLDHYRLIEIHGSVLDYAKNLGDCYHRGGVVAIGDAVSTVNFLGGEGIRHGMASANIAVPFLQDYLNGDRQALGDYEQAMKAHFGKTWQRSERLNQRIYFDFSDAKIDLGVTYLRYLSYGSVLDLLFNYRFDRIYGGMMPLVLKKIAQLSQLCRPWIRSLARFLSPSSQS